MTQEQTAYDLLSQSMQHWIWDQGWEDLRPIQKTSIISFNNHNNPIIISARTASGKTEAAFLPALSAIDPDGPTPYEDSIQSFGIIYIAPLKALITDQWNRLIDMVQYSSIKIYPWHGDIGNNIKQKAVKNPKGGVLLITPESLEGLLTNKRMERLFSETKYIIIDEMHSFFHESRGKQLQSLMRRIELTRQDKPPIRRIGLSATLESLEVASTWLTQGMPHSCDGVEIISDAQKQPINIYNYATIHTNKKSKDQADTTVMDNPFEFQEEVNDENKNIVQMNDRKDEEPDDPRDRELCVQIWNDFSQQKSLIFTNSRANVEFLTTSLNEMQKIKQMPENFYAHHGSLSKHHRQSAESKMKDESLPGSLVCTSTMEMGIDIGNLERVAQIGAAHSVSGLRQRAGRSGRRNGVSEIFQYHENEDDNARKAIGVPSQLALRFVKMLAMGILLERGWNEPLIETNRDFSTMTQQTLALLKEFEGCHPRDLWNILSPVWPRVTPENYRDLLRGLKHKEIIEQTPTGLILPGELGEKLIADRNFQVTFPVTDTYAVKPYGQNSIGDLPVDAPISVGKKIAFAGKYWTITDIDRNQKIIVVERARKGTPLTLKSIGTPIDENIWRCMELIYQNKIEIKNLNQTGKHLLKSAQEAYETYELSNTCYVQDHNGHYIFTGFGVKIVNTLLIIFKNYNIGAICIGEAIYIPEGEATYEQIYSVLFDWSKNKKLTQADIDALTEDYEFPNNGKYDELLPKELLRKTNIQDNTDYENISQACQMILSRFPYQVEPVVIQTDENFEKIEAQENILISLPEPEDIDTQD